MSNSNIIASGMKVLLVDQQGLRDAYTNILHIPESTQSTTVFGMEEIKNDSPSDTSIVYETVIHDNDLNKPKTGLSEIQRSMKTLLMKTFLRAITEQQNFRKNATNIFSILNVTI
ncbi:CGH_1_HP_G0101380.mRNA.1.CDS.1 [Saccharomyces cerevisiae]|nr:CGH_1_HP_G0101380.mRNA.1.CDS.1 [Saccharomyces cerevisiae]CAI6948345.1 CGH_1_HP_G0101380.mRNA.1.CDS.1 [Saccharomyces cerevisiae]